ncbi:MAG: metallophosphoesterase [Patescibacteria group bacterium]|jgi:predicted phosphodiesterase
MKPVYRISGLVLIVSLAMLMLFNLWKPIKVNFQDLTNFQLLKTKEKPLAFAVIGDNEGENSIYTGLIGQIAKDPEIKFLLHVGDATENGTQAEFESLKKLHANLGLKIPIYYIPGNHDLAEDQNGGIWTGQVGPRWQAVDIENIHLVLLDNSNRKIGFEETELAWLENDLADYAKNKLKNSVLVLAYHRPFNYPLASILGDDETKTSTASNAKFLAILAKYPPNQIFTGHIHNYFDFTMALAKDSQGKVTKSVPVIVTGGGGQLPQSALGGLFKPKYHALKVLVQGKTISTDFIYPLEN